MNRKRLLGHVLGIVVVLLVIAYAANRPGHIPLYDANLVRLAETERQGYCAGEAFWKSATQGDAGLAKECRSRERRESGEVNLFLAEKGFCRAIVDQGWEGDVPSCLSILETYQYWPTYDGNITNQWNRARPYPRPAIGGAEGQEDGSRTGGRPGSPSHPDTDRYGYNNGGTP